MLSKKIFFVLLFLQTLCFSQTIKFEGKVLDSLNNPLSYANIIAEPESNITMQFAIADEQGNYQLILTKDSIYSIKASYLGFKSVEFNFKATANTTKNFILTEAENVLGEIKINAKLAVSIKKDTITYQTDKFVTGEERKLRDVLKKLPGVEVDRDGNVKVLGKRVTKVLVENKQFFTGNSKLAVNNIPADAVNEIEILDNYNEVAILKGLEDSNDLAMNIKLKEDKKKFWFGDIEAGIGLENRKVVHPSLFYYSPKRSMYFIGDFNNTGKKSFTFKDYLDFEGGYSKILLNPKAYFSKLNDDFSQFLTNQDFKNSNHIFGGYNITESITDHTDLVGYTIYSKSDNELENNNTNTYINNNTSNIEERITKQNPINQFVISKLSLDNTQEDGTKFKATTFIKLSDNFFDNTTITNLNNTTNTIFNNIDATNLEFREDIAFYKSLTESQTLTFLINYNYAKGITNINWETNNNVFQDIVPILNQPKYSIFKDKKTTSQSVTSLLKHYWVLADFMHLYTTTGIDVYNDNYFSDEYQILENNSINSFKNNGFGNDLAFNFINAYFGANLKYQTGKLTFTTGLFYHYYLRKVLQEKTTQSLNKKYFLPDFKLEYNINRSEKIDFNYNLKVRFPSITKLSQNYTLTGFNSIFRGNNTLENELYHQLSLYYYKFSLFKNLDYNLALNYRKTKSGIKNTTILEGINYISEPVFLDNADEDISFNGSISKTFGSFKFSVNGSNSLSEYLQFLNKQLQTNSSINYSLGGGIKSNFLDLPNFEISYNKSYNKYKTPNTVSNFENENLEINIEYDFWKDFIFKSDYSLENFTNKSINSSNNNAFLNANLYYQKENSFWGFEISANNILNTTFKRSSSFTDFLISDSKMYVLPRIIVFKVSYKLN